VKYMTNGTATSANVVIAGKVRIQAVREEMTASSRAPARGRVARAGALAHRG